MNIHRKLLRKLFTNNLEQISYDCYLKCREISGWEKFSTSDANIERGLTV